MNRTLLLQQVLNGLAIGSVYAIFALGYTLIFSVLDDVRHEYPNGTNNPPNQFSMPDRAWTFFERHPQP